MTDSAYYYCFTEEERQSLKHFFGRDVFEGSYSATVSELTDEQVDQISARFMPRARASLRVSDLLIPLKQYKVLTDTEFGHLRSGSLEQQEQAVRLFESLSNKGSYGLAVLYLSLLVSSESKRGIPAHYQLARELREIVLEYSVSDEENGRGLDGPVKRTESQAMPLRAAVKKLQRITISPVAARLLANHFNLPTHQTPSTDLCELCHTWLSSRSACDMTELVETMVVTEGVGRHTKHLCGPSAVPPQDLRNFFLTLGEQWVEIAKYLGYSTDEIAEISGIYPDSVGKQVDKFLEEWKMPDSGQKTLPLLHKLKGLAGIVDPKRDRSDSLPSSRRPWIDESGLPPRRLDAYPHPKRHNPPPPSTSPHSQHPHQRHTSLYEDYENAPYSSSGTHGTQGRRHIHLMILNTGRMKGSQDAHSHTSGQSMAHQDPVIEELPSDSEEQTHSKSEPHLMENQVAVPKFSSLSSVPPQGRRAVYSRTEQHTPLGNEEPLLPVDGSRSREKRVHPRGDTSPLGNEVPPPKMNSLGNIPGMNNLGNEVPVGIQRRVAPQSDRGATTPGEGGRRTSGQGVSRSDAELLGNEVPMPGFVPSKKFKVSSIPPRSSPVSLGNEVPMPGKRRLGRVDVVDNGLSVPVPLTSGGRAQLGNEMDRDSGYTTTASVASDTTTASVASDTASLLSSSSMSSSSTVRRTRIMSDSGSDSSQNLTSSKPGTLSLHIENESATNPTGNGQHSSPDNDMSSDDHPVPSLSGKLRAQSQASSQSAPLPTQTRPIAESKQPHLQGNSGVGCGGKMEDIDDDEENDLDDEEDEVKGAQVSTGTRAKPPSQLNISLESLPELEPLPHHTGTQVAGVVGGGDGVNDLSAPTPETPQENRVSAPVFMQSSYTLPQDNKVAATVVEPTLSISSLNDLSTNEGGESSTFIVNPLPESVVNGLVEEYCSDCVLQAIQDSNGMDMLTALVESGANINLPFSNGAYPLHEAVVSRKHDTVLFLLNKGANIKQKMSDGKTPLHVACVQKDYDMVQILVEKGADIAAQDKQGYTCLHYKETLEALPLVQYLVHNGAPIDIPSHDNYLTPLMICCCVGNDCMVDTAQFLVSKGANVNGCPQAGMKPLVTVCIEGFEVLVDLLLGSNADVNIQDYDGNSALLKACQGGYVSIAKKLCERRSDSSPTGANVNQTNNEGLAPIMAAVMSNQMELVRTLLKHRATVNCYMTHKLSVGGGDMMLELSPLGHAAASGNIEMVELLIENRANVNATTTARSPMAIAAMCGKLDVVKLFLKLNDLDISLPAIAEPLKQAVSANQIQCAELIATRYGGLERMHDDAVRSNMQELVASITRLQERQQSIVVVAAACQTASATEAAPSTQSAGKELASKPAPSPQPSQPLPGSMGELVPLGSNESGSARNTTDEDLNNLSENENDLDGDNEDDSAVTAQGPGKSSVAAEMGASPSAAQHVLPVTVAPADMIDLNNVETDHANILEREDSIEAQNNVGVSEVVGDALETENNLDDDEPSDGEPDNGGSTVYNDLDAEDSINTASLGGSVAMQNNLEGGTGTSAEVSNDSAVVNGVTVSTTLEGPNTLNMDDGSGSSAAVSVDFQPGTSMDTEQLNPGAVEQQNNLDTEESGAAVMNNDEMIDVAAGGIEEENDLDELESPVHHPTQQTEEYPSFISTLPHSSTTNPSFPSSNAVYTLPAMQSPPVSRATFPTSAPAALGSSIPKHELTEDNQFDENEKQNDFSEDGTGTNDGVEGTPQVSGEEGPSYVELQRQRWKESQEGATMPPAPTSAPVGRAPPSSGGGPLRANVENTPHTALSSVAGGGENLFAPRPKSPPTRAPTPPRPSPYNMLNMDTRGGLEQAGGGRVEVLYDFAQICMLAAVKTKGQEWLINKATQTGYEHLTQFFLQYFHEGLQLSLGGKLVSEFIGGEPSPLNFLLAGRFINQACFQEVAKDLGQPDFMDSLTGALHEFPGSDGLPYTGTEMAEALFNQSFSIGHRYPDPSSLRSSPTSSYTAIPPSNLSSSFFSEPFSGQGHRLGRNSEEYSNLSEPAFHSSGVTNGSAFTTTLEHPVQPQETAVTTLSSSETDRPNDGTFTSIQPQSETSVPSTSVPSLTPVPGPIPTSSEETSASFQNQTSPATLSTKEAQSPPPVHSPTEENALDEELNDLTTEDESPPVAHPHEDHTSARVTLPTLPLQPSTHYACFTSPLTPLLHEMSPHTHQHPLSPFTPSPPPLISSDAVPKDALSSTSLVRPIPRAVGHHSQTSASNKMAATAATLPPSLTPSPELPETLLLTPQTLPIAVGPEVPLTATPPTVSPQSSSGFQSPKPSSSPTSMRKPLPRPLSGGSTGRRDSRKVASKPTTRGKDGPSSKLPNTSSTKTRTVRLPSTASSSRSKQSGSLAKPASKTTPAKKTTQPGTLLNPKAPTTQSRHTVVPKTSPKMTTVASKSPMTARKTAVQPAKGASTTKTAEKSSSVPTSKPPLASTQRTSLKSGRASKSTTTSTAMSRGMPRQKAIRSVSSARTSLTDEVVVSNSNKVASAVPFKSLEPNSGSLLVPTSPHGSVSVDDGISFPDTHINDPDNCAMFQVLAHRVRKWKILGRYLGLDDRELDEIEQSNHFTTERCLKTLVHWGKRCKGNYAELEAGIHNIMREDLIEDVRQFLPMGRSEQCSEEEIGSSLRISGFSVEGGAPSFQRLAKSVTQFVRKNYSDDRSMILLQFSHEKLCSPIELYLPLPPKPSRDYCDLTAIVELCFAASKRNVSTVDFMFEVHPH